MPLRNINVYNRNNNNNPNNIVNNIFINYYLNSLENRLNNNTSILNYFIYYLIAFNYIFHIIKYGLSLFIEYSHETKLLLCDVSLVMGGNREYNVILLILGFIFGFIMNIEFHLSNSNKYLILIQFYKLLKHSVQTPLINIDNNHVDKLNTFLKINYKILNGFVIFLVSINFSIKYKRNKQYKYRTV